MRVFARIREGNFIEDAIGGLLRTVNGGGGDGTGEPEPEPKEERFQVLQLKPVVPAALDQALDHRPVRLLPAAANDRDDDEDSITIAFEMSYEQFGHHQFCGALQDALL